MLSVGCSLLINFEKMLTPRFSLSQDSGFVYIHITAPFIKVTESECYIQEDEFYFYSQPYYLRLHLPGKIVENELSTSKYDVDTGQLTVRVAKETKGECFQGLDMLTKLLTPKSAACSSRDIEVVSSSAEQLCKNSDDVYAEEDDEDELEFDWFLDQKVNELPNDVVTSGPSYGFAHRKCNVLSELVAGLPELLDLKDPDHVSVSDRRTFREEQEMEHFNCEHYLADLFDDDMIGDVISPDYPELTGIVEEETVFSESEQEKLRQLPRREYIINDSELKATYLGLVDLVFAYAYNFRFTQGDGNVEADWTICKLSATLSCLDKFENIHDVVISCARRSLCFPLHRSWKLFIRVFHDIRTIFLVGKSQVLKCLLGIHKVLMESEIRYPLNDLYITDYCVWLQSADSKQIESLGKALGQVNICKADLGLRLDEMEADARKLMENTIDETHCGGYEKDGGDIDRLAETMSNIVHVKNSVDDSDDDSDVDSSSDDDSVSDEDSEDESEDEDGDDDDTDSDSNDNSCTVRDGDDNCTPFLVGKIDSHCTQEENDKQI